MFVSSHLPSKPLLQLCRVRGRNHRPREEPGFEVIAKRAALSK